MKEVFIFSGETSGDLHGSRLMEALQDKSSSCSLFGVGGPRMRDAGLKTIIPMEEFQVMGFSDVVRSFPRLVSRFYQIRDLIIKRNPMCTILIDYPGFNLRLARSLRKKGYRGKLVQYICPTVWAHGAKRIDLLAAYYDLLLTIYPFEAAYFAQTHLKVEYVGNPLVETIAAHPYQNNWEISAHLPADQEIIGLFPGSREGEIQGHLPMQLETASLLRKKYPQLRFALSCAQDMHLSTLQSAVNKSSLTLDKDIFIVPSKYRYELMRKCKTALAKSGTVTLELALHGVPSVVHYGLSPLNYLFAKCILQLKLKHYCIVNILGNQTIFPEFTGTNIASIDLANQVEKIHFDSKYHQAIKERCLDIKHQLGSAPSHEQAAKAILEISF